VFDPDKVLDPDDLIGKTFVSQPFDDNVQQRIEIIGHADPGEEANFLPEGRNNDIIKWKLKVGEHTYDELWTYNQMLEVIERDSLRQGHWAVDGIVGHRKLKNGSWEVKVKWTGYEGEDSWHPLNDIANDDPISVTMYAVENDLLKTQGWKRFARMARRPKKFRRLLNQSKIKARRHAPMYKFGHWVPRDIKEALYLDRANGNNHWAEAMAKEVNKMDDHESFKSLGKGTAKPEGFTMIRVHFVFDVKHDGQYKARLVAGGHMTQVTAESSYSGVVSLRGQRIVAFIAELNDLELWGTDIGKQCLPRKLHQGEGMLHSRTRIRGTRRTPDDHCQSTIWPTIQRSTLA